jgi:DNA-binding transcriptional MerR regulator
MVIGGKDNIVREQIFTIKELESFTGIKAHTIRIWEQRYGLLTPERTETNIRRYTDQDLKRLLNISLLINSGQKISNIAKMSEEEVRMSIITMNSNKEQQESHALHVLKIAMLNYDESMFSKIIDQHIQDKGLLETFTTILIPFLQEIGIMWQADAICPAQEHFISCLIRQKLFHHVETLENPSSENKRTLVLYLPELEIHELSLIMMQYVLKKRGYKCILLGQSVPCEDLVQVHQRLGQVDFVSIFTTNPLPIFMNDYLKKISKYFNDTECHFHLTGHLVKGLKSPDYQLITFYNTVEDLLNNFEA